MTDPKKQELENIDLGDGEFFDLEVKNSLNNHFSLEIPNP